MFYLSACSDDDTIIGNDDTIIGNDTQIAVSGTIFGQSPGWWHNGYRPYSSTTGLPAYVTFHKVGSCCYQSIETDSNSSFNVRVDPGTYTIVWHTAHSRPDTIVELVLERDTILDMNITYEYYIEDTICIEFLYPVTQDSLGLQEEYRQMNQLDAYSGYMIDLANARRSIREISSMGIVIIKYYTPIKSGFHAWQVEDSYHKTLYRYGWVFHNDLSLYIEQLCIYH